MRTTNVRESFSQLRWLVAALGMLGLTGCAHYKNLPPPEPAAIQILSSNLVSLSPAIKPGEALQLSTCAYEYSLELARRYKAVRPAWWHNVLVNTGLKKRGLCYEWAEDLTFRLRELHLSSIELHWAVAWEKTIREHNSVAVCSSGQPFSEGIVLDAWRHSGRLHWAYVGRDRYPWRQGKDLPDAPASAIGSTNTARTASPFYRSSAEGGPEVADGSFAAGLIP